MRALPLTVAITQISHYRRGLNGNPTWLLEMFRLLPQHPANRCCEIGVSSVRDLELRSTNLTISASAI